METRSAKGPIMEPSVDVQASGEGHIKDKEHTGDRTTEPSYDETSSKLMANNNEDVQAEVIQVMTPIMHEAISEMNNQARETMHSIRDALSDARTRDATEMNKFLINTIPTITDSLTPVLQGAMSQIAESVKGVVSELSRATTSMMACRIPETIRLQDNPVDDVTPNPLPSQRPSTVSGTVNPGLESSRQQASERKLSHSKLPSISRQSRQRKCESTNSETESDDASDPQYHALRRGGPGRGSNPRLPAFTGNDWKIWINRFEDVAIIRRWSEQQKLTELLPKLHGVAGEFVYGQLSRSQRSSYNTLVQELEYRFRKVETARTYGSRFSNRSQNPGESIEDYAAELKALYDKAYPSREGKTRSEDLLRRFLDGLLDERVQMQVEYVKEPVDIDQAVYEVVNFMETRKRGKRNRDKLRAPTRMVRPFPDEEDSSEESEDEVNSGRTAKMRGRPSKTDGKAKTDTIVASQNTSSHMPRTSTHDAANIGDEAPETIIKALEGITNANENVGKILQTMVTKLENLDRNVRPVRVNTNTNNRGRQGYNSNNQSTTNTVTIQISGSTKIGMGQIPVTTNM